MRMAATAVAEDTVELLHRFTEERGRGALAVDGARDTIAALGRRQLEVLLVHDDPEDDRTAWYGPERTQLSVDESDLIMRGVEQPCRGRLIDAALRAAIASGTAVRVIPRHGPVAEGIGGLLRWH